MTFIRDLAGYILNYIPEVFKHTEFFHLVLKFNTIRFGDRIGPSI